MKKALFSAILTFCIPFLLIAQEREENFVPERDPPVRAKLDQWQDMKLGLMITWGIYSQWGIVESWSLCGEDEPWCQRTGPLAADYGQYKIAYQDLKKTFNPAEFDPEKWAGAAEAAGMRYMIFTAKHHDGFCMFDTKTTDYRVTSPECPFHTQSGANITRAVLEAFRKKGFLTGVYYSKPDWSSPDYWWPYFPTPDRHVNYDPAKYPDRWQRFKDFTYRQIEELMTAYGTVDILWLDGAWVRPLQNMPKEFDTWAKKNEYDQDIDIPRIVTMARKHQPGLIVVDRWVNGPNENYLTPEQKVPEGVLNAPWESCITMGTSWSYAETDQYKSVQQLVHLLVEVVAKGGNLLLNIGPSPEGKWAPDAFDRLKGMGEWMKVNSEAIYGTRPIAPFKDDRIYLTEKRTNGAVYAICLAEENQISPPGVIRLHMLQPASDATLVMLGAAGNLRWRAEENGISIEVPGAVRQHPPCEHAWTVKISKLK